MDFLTLTGHTKNISITRFFIDWDGDSLSKFQKGVKDFLRPYWEGKRVTEELPCAGTRLRIDFVNLDEKIAIEVNGSQHDQMAAKADGTPRIHFFHNNSRSGYLAQLKRDVKKAKWCDINGYKLVEILPTDLPLTPAFFLKRYDIAL